MSDYIFQSFRGIVVEAGCGIFDALQDGSLNEFKSEAGPGWSIAFHERDPGQPGCVGSEVGFR
jgi:hypothetical protein